MITDRRIRLRFLFFADFDSSFGVPPALPTFWRSVCTPRIEGFSRKKWQAVEKFRLLAQCRIVIELTRPQVGPRSFEACLIMCDAKGIRERLEPPQTRDRCRNIFAPNASKKRIADISGSPLFQLRQSHHTTYNNRLFKKRD